MPAAIFATHLSGNQTAQESKLPGRQFAEVFKIEEKITKLQRFKIGEVLNLKTGIPSFSPLKKPITRKSTLRLNGTW